ncbi:MAG: VanZ family protein [Gemmatimonadaceae bacterium]
MLITIVIAFVTLGDGIPPNATEVVPPWTCLVCGAGGGADALLNVALFVPLGAALFGAGVGRGRSLLLCITASAAIEVAQATVIPFRYPALGDVVWNGVGGGLGVLAAAAGRRLVLPDPQRAASFAWWAVGGFSVVMALTVAAFRPVLPSGHYQIRDFHRCVPSSIDRGPWLVDFEYGDVVVRRGDLVPRASLEGAWREGALRVSGHTNPSSCEDIQSLVSFTSGLPDEIAALSRSLTSVSFRVRLRAIDLRLRQPSVIVPVDYVALYGEASAPVEGRYVKGRLSVAYEGRADVRRSELWLSPGLGWALLYPFAEALHLGITWMNFVWISLLTLPIGYFMMASLAGGDAPIAPTTGDAGRVVAVQVVLVGAVLLVAGWVTVRQVMPVELVAALAGLALGAGAARLARAIAPAWSTGA